MTGPWNFGAIDVSRTSKTGRSHGRTGRGRVRTPRPRGHLGRGRRAVPGPGDPLVLGPARSDRSRRPPGPPGAARPARARRRPARRPRPGGRRAHEPGAVGGPEAPGPRPAAAHEALPRLLPVLLPPRPPTGRGRGP